MTSAVQLYEALATAPDDKTRAKLIAEAIERLEERYPHLPDLTTRAHLRETELCLREEIGQVRANLKAGIEQLRSEIEQLRSELKTEIANVKLDLIKWIVPMMFAQVAVIAALVKLL
ncbi:DUF1640 domain-containing protein [Candidatus Thiosymbion oneisti]|uniref:DUF1640 domain-containing protein n=1 Tax=Candidatus Thiosymbion oneisti TaxID=589554 RepID=UPI000B7D17B4|nr:DUF1640 domain-containing protein [Candidatus Thiosymbion oneisti]